ncbi:MAG TPA: hypothetical protein VEX57_14895 [Microlunatus sp.]|nr:hypothetical protein [Microlunatus sp.]
MVASVDEEGGGRDRHHRVRGDGRSAGVPARETAMLVWRRRPGSGGLAIAMLVYFLLESISITVDQWFAGTANPTTTVASAAAVFAILTVIDLAVLALAHRHLQPHVADTAVASGGQSPVLTG